MRPERLARAGAVSLLGSGIGALAALLVTSVVGNALGASGTGIFFQAVGIFTILTQVMRLGTNSGIVRFISEQRAFGRAGNEGRIIAYAAGPVFVLSVAVSFAVWFYANALATWLASPGEAQTLAELLRAMAPFVALGTLIGVAQIAARMLRGVPTFTVLQGVLLPLSRLGAVLIGTLAGVTVLGAFEAWLWPIPFWFVITLIIIIAPIVRDRRKRDAEQPAPPPGFGRFWRFNSPRAVSSALETALEWVDVLIVAALASPAAAGVYAVVTRVVRAGGLVDKAMRVAVSPTISGLLARDLREEATRLHTEVVRAMILMNWPFYVLLISMGPAVLAIFGEEFTAGWGPMTIIAASMMFQTAAGMLQSILLQGGRSTWQMYNKSLALLVSVGGNLLLVPPFGVWGAALTWCFVMIVDNLIAAFQVHRGMGVHLQPFAQLGAAVIPVMVFGAGGALFSWIWGTSMVGLIVAVVILGSVYAGVLWLLRRALRIERLWRKVPLIGRWV